MARNVFSHPNMTLVAISNQTTRDMRLVVKANT